MDPELASIGLRSMDELIDIAEPRRRFQVLLMACFARLAALLAAIRIYGVMANTVGPIAFVSMWAPARAAAKVDPVIALREGSQPSLRRVSRRRVE